MVIEVELTNEVLVQLVQAHGVLKEAGNPAGRDCFQLKTAKGVYMVPTYRDGMCAPCDQPCFIPEGQHYEMLDPNEAVTDPEIAALLSAATVQFTGSR